MLHCLRSTPLASNSNRNPSSPTLQGNSNEGTPRSISQPSPTVNLTSEYTLAVQTSSYGEVWSKLHQDNSSSHEVESEKLDDPEEDKEERFLAQILQPNREAVQEALRYAKPSTLTTLVSAYFDKSEQTSHLLHLLYLGVQCARSQYAPLYDLISVLPLDSESETLSQLQCDQALSVFLHFDSLKNPFPQTDSYTFNEIRTCFAQLKQQLDSRLYKSRSRIQLFRRTTVGCAICLIGTVVGVTLSVLAIATHVFVAFVACPGCSALLPLKIAKKELAHMAVLDAAARSTYVLDNDLDTIDRLVALLQTKIEGDKRSIRLGLDRGSDRYLIQEVAKQLQKNRLTVLGQLSDLEVHLCLSFAAINRARSLLLQEILLHQIHLS